MRSDTWLEEATRRLSEARIGTARLDALVLLEDALNKSRTQILTYPETEVPAAKIKVLNAEIARRARHEPLAYIRGKTEFFAREFIITPAVLEPRPESETIIELLKDTPLPNNPTIADVGTGSGALGITAALELENVKVDLLEIDLCAAEVAKRNVAKYQLDLAVIKSNLLTQSQPPYDILLCNLPYVPDDFQINPAAQAEPRVAIFGGADGLDVYRKLFEQLRQADWRPKYVFTEALPFQHEHLAKIANDAGFEPAKTEDFIQVFR